jgi:hypothetical protein
MENLKSLIREILSEVEVGLYNFDTVAETINELKTKLKGPVIQVKYSTLGGNDKVTISVVGSLDEKDTWVNGIFENSRYFMFMIMQDGTIEQFRKSYKIPNKFRKTRVKSIQDAIKKINMWVIESSK